MISKKVRVLFKISGAALMGNRDFVHDCETIKSIVTGIKSVYDTGVQICIVVGGGNIYRGIESDRLCMERSIVDHMGMLGTIINALALQSILEQTGIDTRVQSAISMTSICEPFIKRRAIRHIEKNRIVIFAAGIGSPLFSTDTAAVLRAVEMKCDCLLKATNVPGIFNTDPKKTPEAFKYNTINYSTVIEKNLGIMDTAAIAIAQEHSLPIKVFSVKSNQNFLKVLNNKGEFTLIH
ncbi:UMP kinase [Rickettsia endosymbiont of Cardiosporidium cionae]|uniref:UMP kinase n=1 Tax=Rickettsia endosymbiont of Cardiosporidium cionae TaxID=2777155 RepID=UPI00189416D7|nr:UMP kinase [Rickettsia endosymbiont of Cardiosporidium cionae]KAF8818553.1 UMP kinase [Rickettsia endosymbiont of Cardiosporidium cionae]